MKNDPKQYKIVIIIKSRVQIELNNKINRFLVPSTEFVEFIPFGLAVSDHDNFVGSHFCSEGRCQSERKNRNKIEITLGKWSEIELDSPGSPLT